jgi:hypothetical protein
MSTLYVPGLGDVTPKHLRVHKAVKEYEERCSFKRNPDTGQMCVYITMPRGWDPPEIPVVGWNEEAIPHEDDVVKWLYQHDASRHGDKLRQDMNKRNEDRKKAAWYDLENDHVEATAEAMEFEIRKAGEHPNHKSLRKVPKKGD